MLHDLLYRLRMLFRHQDADAELEAELEYHLDRHAEKLKQAGIPADDAMRQARIRLGGPEQVRQQCRESRGTGLLEDALQDLRYGARTLLSRPGFTAVVVLTLALGIGACTAIFSLMNVVLFPEKPFDTHGLVYLYTPYMPLNSIMVWPLDLTPSDADYFDIKRQSRSYAETTYFVQQAYKEGGASSTLTVGGVKVDANFLRTLGVEPLLGRAIDTDDCRMDHDMEALVSYRLWQERYRGNADVLGQTLQLDGREYRIIGVMPEGFHYPEKTDLDESGQHFEQTDVWTPLTIDPKQLADRTWSEGDSYALARLKPGISAKQAQAEMSGIVTQLEQLNPAPFKDGWKALVKPLQETLVGTARPLMWLLFGAVVFVMLIACGNAANLLLARGASRVHELGMRATLGAGRGRLIRQMLTESLLLGMAGGIVGIGLAYGFLKLLLTLDPGNIPRLQESRLDLRVLGFTLAVTLLTSVLTGILPALSSSRINLIEFLKSGGSRGAVGTRSKLNGRLVVVEVALVVVLLSGAGLLLRSYEKVESAPKGFAVSTLSMRLDLGAGYRTPEQTQGFFRGLVERLNAMPGVQSAGIVESLPFSNHNSAQTFWVQGYANKQGQLVESHRASPGYFEAMVMPMVKGRAFTGDDSAGHPEVAIINDAFAKKYFAGLDPIGRKVWTDQPNNPAQKMSGGKTVVGVVGDIHQSNMEEAPGPQLFLPWWQGGGDENSGYIAIRSLLPVAETTAEAKSALRQMDPTLTFANVRTMGKRVSKSEARRRFQTTLLAVFAGMALLLALVGLYGLLAYSVRLRTPELGVRLALGSPRGRILQLVVGQGVKLVVAGLVIGMAAAFALTRLLSSLLFGVHATDPVTYAAVGVLLLAAGVMACLIPGLRAAKIDPARSLRYE
jgi:predicted permease